MEGHHPYEKYYEELEPVIKSKAEEFTVIGYGAVEMKDLWNYLMKKKWKNAKTDDVHMYSLVSDILSVKPGDFMSFMAVEAYRSPDWFADLDEAELDELLNPDKAK